MKNLLKSLFLFTILFVLACNDPECNVNDFVGTVNGSFTELSSGACIPDFPNTFELNIDSALGDDEDVAILIADTLAYALIFNGANDEGCLFTIFTVEDNRQQIGSGNLNGDNLTFGIFIGNSSNIGCSFAGVIEN